MRGPSATAHSPLRCSLLKPPAASDTLRGRELRTLHGQLVDQVRPAAGNRRAESGAEAHGAGARRAGHGEPEELPARYPHHAAVLGHSQAHRPGVCGLASTSPPPTLTGAAAAGFVGADVDAAGPFPARRARRAEGRVRPAWGFACARCARWSCACACGCRRSVLRGRRGGKRDCGGDEQVPVNKTVAF
jgi:hypothetical protein